MKVKESRKDANGELCIDITVSKWFIRWIQFKTIVKYILN